MRWHSKNQGIHRGIKRNSVNQSNHRAYTSVGGDGAGDVLRVLRIDKGKGQPELGCNAAEEATSACVVECGETREWEILAVNVNTPPYRSSCATTWSPALRICRMPMVAARPLAKVMPEAGGR